MKELVEKYCADLITAIATQDAGKITQHFAPNAKWKWYSREGMMDMKVEEVANACLEHKDVPNNPHKIERIDELANGTWISIMMAVSNGTPYHVVSFYKFDGDKIVELVEYYGDY